MTKTITVGYDNGDGAKAALRWAADEASLRGCELRVVSAFSIPTTGDWVAGWTMGVAQTMVIESTQAVLEEVKGNLAMTHPDVDVSIECVPPPAAAALLEGVREDDLIVVGASAHKGGAAFWLGSTPRSVVRRAPCPVVVVREADGPHRPERVVIGVDGSTTSDAALSWGVDEATLLGVPVVVVHAWEYPYAAIEAGVPLRAVDFAASQARDVMRVDAARVLERSVEMGRERARVTVEDQLVEGPPASGLLSFVRDGDLLVIGTRGRGLLSGGFGSTANAVLDRAHVPVAVIRGTSK